MRYVISIIYLFIGNIPHYMDPIRILYLLVFSLWFNSQYRYWHFSGNYSIDNHEHFVIYEWLPYFVYLVSVWVESSFAKLNVISCWNVLFESDPLFLLSVIFSSFLGIVKKAFCTSLWNLCLSMLMVVRKILFNDHEFLMLEVFRNGVPYFSAPFQEVFLHKVVYIWKAKCFEYFWDNLCYFCIESVSIVTYNVEMRMTTPCLLQIFIYKFRYLKILLIPCFVFKTVILVGAVCSCDHMDNGVISFLSHLDLIQPQFIEHCLPNFLITVCFPVHETSVTDYDCVSVKI